MHLGIATQFSALDARASGPLRIVSLCSSLRLFHSESLCAMAAALQLSTRAATRGSQIALARVPAAADALVSSCSSAPSSERHLNTSARTERDVRAPADLDALLTSSGSAAGGRRQGRGHCIDGSRACRQRYDAAEHQFDDDFPSREETSDPANAVRLRAVSRR